MQLPILLRGGGDLASGVAFRLRRAGFPLIITELAQPLSVRRLVCFSEAIYEGQWEVEGMRAQRVDSLSQALDLSRSETLPVLIAPEWELLADIPFSAVIDARLTKTSVDYFLPSFRLLIGLGPGFTAGENCHAYIETMRGHTLGRVFWSGSALPDNGFPEGDPRRVLRAPIDGVVLANKEIGQHVRAGEVIASVGGQTVVSPLSGTLRGLIRPGVPVSAGAKIGDIDERNNPEFCSLVSDKALAIGGGVLEALLANRQKP